MERSTCSPGEIEEITQLFAKVFSDSEGQSEGLIIGTLAHDLLTGTDENDFYCFVASEGEQIIGSIIFSRLTFENAVSAFLLSPVAIDTNHQGKGIGQKLINFGLNVLKENGIELVLTYGDPRYYAKIGFNPITEKIVKAPLPLSQPEGWLGQSLVNDEIVPIAGNSQCVEAMNKPEIW